MPKLDDERRQSINERLALHERLWKSFEGQHYISQECRLCGWMSNGLTLEEAIAENRKHESTHPEIAQIDATEISIGELRTSLHDHDCKMELCACKCGCQVGPFCTLIFGPLCSACTVAANRGHDEHGEK